MTDIKFDIKIRHIETGNTFREIITLDEIITSGKLYTKGIQEVVFKRQFTGLKDETGKEIYDRDITSDFAIVKYDISKGGFALYKINNGIELLYCFPIDCKRTLIIGNIYENPELLS